LPSLSQRIDDIYERRQYNPALSKPSRWLSDGKSYALFERLDPSGPPEFARYDAATGKREVLFSLAQVKAVEPSKSITFSGNFTVSRDGMHMLAALNDRRDANGTYICDYWLFEREPARARKIAIDVESPDTESALSPDGARVAYPRAHDLHVYDAQRGSTVRMTHDGAFQNIGNVAGRWGSRILRWSPDSKRVAFVRNDYRRVGMFPLIDNTAAAYPKPRFTRFPQVGTPIPSLRLGVANAKGGAVRWIEFNGRRDSDYFGAVTWIDGQTLSVDRLIRPKDVRDLFLSDISTGKSKSILHEQDPAWVQDQFSLETEALWRRDGNAFVWQSERDGWRRAYNISGDGARLSALTPAGIDVLGKPHIDEDGGWLYYAASPENATQRYLYRVPLDGSASAERITPQNQPGTHHYEIAPGARYAFHTYSTADSPPVIEVIALPSHQTIRVLEDNAPLRQKFATLKPMPTEFAKVDIGNGVVLDAWLLKPRDFDPSRKYPVLVFVYGEPASQTVIDAWNIGQGKQLLHRAISDVGYVVVSMDNRSTPAPKGSAWRRSAFGSQGPLSSEEQAAALRELARARPYLDPSRVAIWGWSAGGTNTLNALFRYPDQYQVGIAVASKPRPDLYNAPFQETYMRTPQQNADGYRKGDVLNFAEGLKGDLLIIHGTGEDNTHVQHVEHLVNRLIELGKPFDYMTYPGRGHGLDEGKGTSAHVHRLIARYLIEHLEPGPK
jgi:dipeptidyl-peptidase 4